MSESISTAKAAALTLASNIVEKGTTAEATIQVANKFLAYITESSAPPAQTEKVSTPARATAPPANTAGKLSATPSKKAATKSTPAEPPKPAEPETADGADIDWTGEAGKAAVGDVVSKLIAANRRPEAISLLAEYDATAVSGVKVEDREAFVNEGQTLLASGNLMA